MADRAVVPANDATQQAEEAEIPVVVAVHVRPLIHDEVVSGCQPCLSVSDREPQVRPRFVLYLLDVDDSTSMLDACGSDSEG